MKTVLVILLAIFLIPVVLLFIPTYLVFELSKEGESHSAVLRIKYLFFSIKLIPKDAPKKKKRNKKGKKNPEKAGTEKKEDKPLKERIEHGIEVYKKVEDDIAEIIMYAKRHAVTVGEISFLMNFGLSGAMETGIATGALYGVIYNIISLIHHQLSVQKCNVSINPDFEKQHIDIHAKCILKVKNVHIMVIVFKVLKLYFKISKI